MVQRTSTSIKIRAKNGPGRPRIARGERDQGERFERLRYNRVLKHRQLHGEIPLIEWTENLFNRKPGVPTCIELLAAIEIKHAEHDHRKPKYKRCFKNVAYNADAFYILPPTLLAACLAQFPLSNCRKTAVAIDRSGEPPARVEVVQIPKVGAYTREQIQAMVKLASLKQQCTDATKLIKWLSDKVRLAVPARMQEEVLQTAHRIRCAFPALLVEGVGTPVYFAELYRICPPKWLNDGLIIGFCSRLSTFYPGVAWAGPVIAHTRITRTLKPGLDAVHLTKIHSLVDAGCPTILLPVNFGNSHWGAIVIDQEAQAIMHYDSMRYQDCRLVLEELAWALT
jgi:hypothetical protein